jgi:hypothetical protein
MMSVVNFVLLTLAVLQLWACMCGRERGDRTILILGLLAGMAILWNEGTFL